MRRIRISLRLLILLLTCAALFLGFSSYRRHTILKLATELREDGYFITVQNEWLDVLWQRAPRQVRIEHGIPMTRALSMPQLRAIYEENEEREKLDM